MWSRKLWYLDLRSTSKATATRKYGIVPKRENKYEAKCCHSIVSSTSARGSDRLRWRLYHIASYHRSGEPPVLRPQARGLADFASLATSSFTKDNNDRYPSSSRYEPETLSPRVSVNARHTADFFGTTEVARI
jgi:hypothetical protein